MCVFEVVAEGRRKTAVSLWEQVSTNAGQASKQREKKIAIVQSERLYYDEAGESK
jgi:hypothetical protein